MLNLHGGLTIYTAGDSKAALIEALMLSDSLEVGLANVTEMDSAGLQVLILAKREAVRQGKRLALSQHSPAMTELIELYNLAGWFADPLIIPASPH